MTIAVLGAAGPAVADPPEQADTSGYTLFDPTPESAVRGFSPDRPGKAHSAQTLDPGWFDIESDFYNYTYDRAPDGSRTRLTTIVAPLFKAGLTDWADLEFGFQLYSKLKSAAPGTRPTTADGFGDVSIGSKINIFGNGEDSALAVLPFIKLPTAAAGLGNGLVEASVNLPYNFTLGDGWTATLEPGLALLENAQNTGYHGEYSFAALVAHPVIGDTVSATLELYGEASGDRHIQAFYTLDPSVQWLVTPWLQLDVGLYIGLNKAAPDYDAYTGIAIRY